MDMEAELEENLKLLEHTKGLLGIIFLGLALQYHSLELQRCQLLAEQDPDLTFCGLEPIQVQTAASLIVLCALFGFQKQSEELASEALREGMRPDLFDVKLGAASILIALIRLARLNLPGGAVAQEVSSGASEETLENAEELENLPL